MSIALFLADLNKLGIEISVEEERLHYSAPKGRLTPDLRIELIRRKQEIINFLSKSKSVHNCDSLALVAISRDKPLPLSFAQQRLWFLDQLTPNSTAYNIPLAVRMKGKLNVTALTESLNAIIERHEILRTICSIVDEQPIQKILSSITLTLPILDLQELDGAIRESEALTIVTKEARQPFELTLGPLLRVLLLRLAEQEHILLLTTHHFVADGWSIGIFIREIAILYQAISAGKPALLPTLSIQYADFAYWQQQWSQGEEFKSQLHYWKNQLANLPILELPTDYPRPLVQSFHGSKQNWVLSRELTEKLKAFHRQQGITLYGLLLTAFQILLSRYSGRQDFVVATPISNRTRIEAEVLIGFFANTLLLRANLFDNPSFIHLLARVRQVTSAAYANQDVPFEKIVDELQAKRDMNYTPLFQVMFVLHNAPRQNVTLPGLTITPLGIELGTAMFDLSLSMVEIDARLIISLEYNTDLFVAETIIRMLGHYQTLLENIVEKPSRRISELSIMTEAERQQLLVECNSRSSDYQTELSVAQVVEIQAARTPAAIAVSSSEGELSYQELNERANQLAHYLREIGIRTESIVGVYLERSLELTIALLGIMKAAGAYLVLDPSYPRERLAYMVEDAGLQVVVTKQEIWQRLGMAQLRLVCMDAEKAKIEQEDKSSPDSSISRDNLAYSIYTSGSSGKPKGVLISHGGLVNSTMAIAKEYELGMTDKVLQFASIGFDVAAEEIFASWVSGANVVLRDGEETLEIAQFLSRIEERAVTVLNLPSSYWHELVEELVRRKRQLPASVRLVIAGGEKVHSSRLRQWQEVVGERVRWCNAYGPSETTITATIYEGSEYRGGGLGSVPIGRAIANVGIYILDERQQLLPIGVIGEIYIGGAGLARGYLNRADLTAEKFLPNPYSGEAGA
ncbi:MAG: amino acid adenylation domain-containing protein, partial [Acidobacteriota bacterium]